jgi:hypothetical protein
LKSGKKKGEKAFLVTWLDKKETRREEKEGRAGSYNACDVVV